MSFPRYPKYKDSGVEWLGEVPEHWEVTRFLRVVHIAEGQVDPGDPVYSAIPLIAPNHIESRTGRLLGLESAGEQSAESGKYPCKAGDVLYSKIRPALRKACIAPQDCLCSADMYPLRAVRGLINPFLFWWILSEQFSALAVLESQRVAMPKINRETLKEIYILTPPFVEQHGIADYLNDETIKIDALIAEQQRLIDLLKEKRQAVISHAVTKGLNPKVRMKDSGIEWLSEVPEHWVVLPIRFAAKLESGHTPSRQHPEYWGNCTVPWFTLADVWQIRDARAEYISETKEKISELGLANSSARLLPKGTVILSRTASVGFSAIMAADMATTQDFANWVCGHRLKPEFLLYVLRAMGCEFERLMMGSTHNTIYMPDIQSLRFALPPLNEQSEIVNFVRGRVNELDSLTSEAQRAIDLLQERRTALISAAVTGQIDVRGFQPAKAA